MQRKKYLSSGLATLALVVYLWRGELNDCLSSNFPEAEERSALLGETVGLYGADILRDADLSAAGMKGTDRYAEEVFRDIRMLAEYPLTRRFDVVSAWLVDGSGSEPSRRNADGEAAAAAMAAAAPAAANSTAAPSTDRGESADSPASELTAEDMDLIDILWRQDMDMGVGRETYDPVLRMELEKERQLELKKQAEKEAAEAEAKRKLLMSNFTVDPETGELLPLGACNGSAGEHEKAFETGFWSRPQFGADELPCSYSIDELLGESSAAAPLANGSGVQPAAAASLLPDQASYDDYFLNQLALEGIGYGGGEMARPGGLAFAAVPAMGSAVAGMPLQTQPTVSYGSHGLQAVLPGSWEAMGTDWQQQQQLIDASNAAVATQPAGWLLDCSGDDEQAYDFAIFPGVEEDEGEIKGACASMPTVDATLAYDFAVFPGIEEDEGEIKGACAPMPTVDPTLASIFDDGTAIADFDLDALDIDMDCLNVAEGKQDALDIDMDCLNVAEGKQNFIDMIDLVPVGGAGEHDANSMSSDSAISMDVASTFEDWAESSPESSSSSECAAWRTDTQTGPSDLSGGVAEASKARSKRPAAAAHRSDAAVQHNHTYTAQPGGQPHVRKMDMKKQAQSDQSSRDERSAKELGLPFSADAVVSAPVDEFNAMVRSHSLTEAQMRLVRDIRRRGKNKVAAQNCRRRKLGALVELGGSLESLRERRQAMEERRSALRRETSAARGKLVALYDGLLKSLRAERSGSDGEASSESSRFELRLVAAGGSEAARRRLLLLPTAPGPGIGAAALREAIASSTSLLPTATAGGGGSASASTNAHERRSAAGGSGRARSHAASQK